MVYNATNRKGLNQDTIVAIATAKGKAGIGIIRVSGFNLTPIFQAICPSRNFPQAREAKLYNFFDGQGKIIDHGFVLFFPAPLSFTGEDVLEFQCHGNPIVLDILLERILELGAVLAQPGEFSLRAFLNGKIDLIQAEAIADLIDAKTEKAVYLAKQSLQGTFSIRIHELVKKIIAIRVEIEAWLDFPDDELEFGLIDKQRAKLEELETDVSAIIHSTHVGCIMQEGITMVISGPPNIGKSSLLNQLSQNDTAIVTDIAGTTRDIIKESIQLDGFPVLLIDTAGIRQTRDPVEMEGIRRAREAMKTADLILVLRDDFSNSDDAILEQIPAQIPRLIVQNKIDLSDGHYGKSSENNFIRISAKYGLGIDVLKNEILKTVGVLDNEEGIFMARRRHLDALNQALCCVKKALLLALSDNQMDLIAEELFQAQQSLNSITGTYTNEDLLGQIFSSFCIGK